jgi:hypothetical protein
VAPPVAQNAMRPLGTWGAINIRFLFGFPFSPVHWLQGGGKNAGPSPA